MEFEHLKLKATKHEHIDVLSTLLQDSLFHHHTSQLHKDDDGCVTLLLNRFCWEVYDEDDLEHYRIHSIVHICNVTSVHVNQPMSQHDHKDFLYLLGMHSTNENEIVLVFSENKCVKLTVNDILVYMKDVDNPWITHYAPKHEI